MCGTLLDQPHLVAPVASQLAASEYATRYTAAGSDFFASAPEGRDSYLSKWILMTEMMRPADARLGRTDSYS
jgi:hypothetical protein